MRSRGRSVAGQLLTGAMSHCKATGMPQARTDSRRLVASPSSRDRTPDRRFESRTLGGGYPAGRRRRGRGRRVAIGSSLTVLWRHALRQTVLGAGRHPRPLRPARLRAQPAVGAEQSGGASFRRGRRAARGGGTAAAYTEQASGSRSRARTGSAPQRGRSEPGRQRLSAAQPRALRSLRSTRRQRTRRGPSCGRCGGRTRQHLRPAGPPGERQDWGGDPSLEETLFGSPARLESALGGITTHLFDLPRPQRWYERWWVWTLVGVTVTAAVVVPLAVRSSDPYHVSLCPEGEG